MCKSSTEVLAQSSARRYAIMVSFRVRQGAQETFLRLVRANAATSVAMEPGCRRFDVLVPCNSAPDDIVLYEIYDDRAAFEAHLASEHFASFDRETKAIVTNKSVICAFEAIENAKPHSNGVANGVELKRNVLRIGRRCISPSFSGGLRAQPADTLCQVDHHRPPKSIRSRRQKFVADAFPTAQRASKMRAGYLSARCERHERTKIGAAINSKPMKKRGPTVNLSSLIHGDNPRERRHVKAGIRRKKIETKPLLLSVIVKDFW